MYGIERVAAGITSGRKFCTLEAKRLAKDIAIDTKKTSDASPLFSRYGGMFSFLSLPRLQFLLLPFNLQFFLLWMTARGALNNFFVLYKVHAIGALMLRAIYTAAQESHPRPLAAPGTKDDRRNERMHPLIAPKQAAIIHDARA